MKVRDVMQAGIVTIPADATYEQAAKVLFMNNVNSAPVVDAGGRAVGTVSEKDLFRILFPHYKSFYEAPDSYTDLEKREDKMDEIRHHPVTGFMAKEVVTVSPDDPIMKAGALMLAHSVNRLPVMDAGKLIGTVSRKHIYRNILKKQLGME